jgi:hypothetical protein
MSENVEIVNTASPASSYAAALMCHRLLRALLANIAFTILIVSLLASVLLIVMFGPGVGSVVLEQPPSEITRWSTLGVLFLVGLVVALVGMAAIVLFLYGRIERSTVVGWCLLSLAAMIIAAGGVDFGLHVAHVFSAPEAERGKELLRGAQNLYPIYVALGFAYGSFGFIRIVRSRYRGVLFDKTPRGGRRVSFYRLMGIPISNGDHRRQLRQALGLAWIAFVCEGCAFSTYFTGGSQDVTSMSLGAAAAFVAIGWPFSALAMYAFLALARWLRRRARRAAQPSLQEAISLDKRPPILFLRSFKDDQVSLASARVPRYLRVMDPGVVASRFEEMLVFNYSHVGPVIAIGNPNDAITPIGAGRGYLSHDDWRHQVLDIMSRSRAIVVSLSDTEGLAWELDRIRDHEYLGKALFIVPPELSNRFNDIRNRACRAGLRLNVDAPPGRGGDDAGRLGVRVIACWQNASEGETIVCSSQLSELDYEIALRLFIDSSKRR